MRPSGGRQRNLNCSRPRPRTDPDHFGTRSAANLPATTASCSTGGNYCGCQRSVLVSIHSVQQMFAQDQFAVKDLCWCRPTVSHAFPGLFLRFHWKSRPQWFSPSCTTPLSSAPSPPHSRRCPCCRWRALRAGRACASSCRGWAPRSRRRRRSRCRSR